MSVSTLFNQRPAFLTRDLGLASWLSARGCKLILVDNENPKRVTFTFSGVVPEDLSSYHTSSLDDVSPESLFDHYRKMKQELFKVGVAR